MVENTGKQVQTNAAVESFRNEMVKANMVTLALVNEQSKKEKEDPIKQAAKQVGSIWDNIQETQAALELGAEITEDISLLSNQKLDKKKGTKGKKNVRNNKQRNSK